MVVLSGAWRLHAFETAARACSAFPPAAASSSVRCADSGSQHRDSFVFCSFNTRLTARASFVFIAAVLIPYTEDDQSDHAGAQQSRCVRWCRHQLRIPVLRRWLKMATMNAHCQICNGLRCISVAASQNQSSTIITPARLA